MEEVAHSCDKMESCVSSKNAVVSVCIDLHVELFVGLHQSFAIFRGVAEVYIVIGSSMDK